MNSTQTLTDITRTSFTNSNTVSYPDVLAMTNMNLGYREGIKSILAKAPAYFWTWGFANSVVAQNEYAIAQFTLEDATQRDVLSIDKVAIKYTTTGTFTQLLKQDFQTLNDDASNYSNYTGEPFYYVRDNSVFIFPSPTVAVTGGIKISGNYRPLDLTLSAVTTQIKTPLLNNIYLSYYQAFMYWSAQLREDKASYYEAKCKEEIDMMCRTIRVRDNEPIVRKTPFNKYL